MSPQRRALSSERRVQKFLDAFPSFIEWGLHSVLNTRTSALSDGGLYVILST